MNADAIEPTIDKINAFVEGFFWALPNIGIALVVLLLFVVGAWLAKRAVIGIFNRQQRADLAPCWVVSSSGR
jgi:small conductance mechanosensitive channel